MSSTTHQGRWDRALTLRRDRRIPSCSKCARAGVTCIDVDNLGSGAGMPRAALTDALARVEWLEDLVRKRLPDIDLNEPIHGSKTWPTPPAKRRNTGTQAEDDGSLLVEAQPAAFDLGLISSNLCVPRLNYFGASSGSLFTRLLRSNKGGNHALSNLPTPTNLDDSAPLDGVVPPVHGGSCPEPARILALVDELRTILPPRDECDRLVRMFLFHYHPIYPILHWPSLYALVAALYSSIEPSSVSSLQANGWPAHVAPFSYNGELACVDSEDVSPISLPTAAAILLSVLSAASYLQAHNIRFGPDPRRYDDKAFALTSTALAEISLPSVQLVVLSVIQGFLSQRSGNSWVLLNLGMAYAIDMGIHRNTSLSGRFSVLTFQMRRRSFFCLYRLNRLISAIQGRPLSFHDDTLDLTMPEVFPSPGDEVSESDQAHLSYSITRFRWACLVSEIKQKLYQISSSKLSESSRSSIQSDVHARLDAWLVEVQQSVESISKPNTSPLLIKARIDYHYAVALLYQPSLACPRPDTTALRHCFESATERVHLFWSLYEEKGLILSWPTAQGISLAGTTLAYCVCASEEILASLSFAKLSADLRLCSSLLTLGGEWWESARRGSKNFHRLANLTMDALFNRGEHAPNGIETRNQANQSNVDILTIPSTSSTDAEAEINVEDMLYSFLQSGFSLTDMPGDLSPDAFVSRTETDWDNLLQTDYQSSDNLGNFNLGLFEPPA
ncbi:hypothetical protein BGW36DRAFT_409056 [Talaromyces proteolyticus]|uniref:Xylanolytic transcriptional activator regulatory domain-containing protein n=1 Tax=Talaromyces proteolyticus TaxID=1131652 RepID=A0AAD4KLP9_9EURO|nr:uncharacterized protein BGW36DRAFT_409056 [Talaromyces proteolyticus]KAH8695479.1 hypothetical protein BGW36DRAFT_409056 [Talaromyces proteolyticus]